MSSVGRISAGPRGADRNTEMGRTASGLLLGALVAPGVLGVSAAVIALPLLARELAFTTSQASWVLAGYILA